MVPVFQPSAGVPIIQQDHYHQQTWQHQWSQAIQSLVVKSSQQTVEISTLGSSLQTVPVNLAAVPMICVSTISHLGPSNCSLLYVFFVLFIQTLDLILRLSYLQPLISCLPLSLIKCLA
ncbi:hypothetical protein ElyMa_002939800 [Elysia marginata]|uniref:Uncharacterized protein n=1 Tax=Elysia marginata TaxID=1093978 RepID=A0AAV4I584_9GAST|nr:hypothetical protein ElyMa_002939800 [Elysia marginata]